MTISHKVIVLFGSIAYANIAISQVFIDHKSFANTSIAPGQTASVLAGMHYPLVPKIGMQVNGTEAEFNNMSLRDLILFAYACTPDQLRGPEWLPDRLFTIKGTLPSGSTTSDIPLMLQALLESRFRLLVHREVRSQQVMGLVVSKSGPKLIHSDATSSAEDDKSTTAYDSRIETADGTVYIYANGHEGSTLKASMTLPGFADLLTNILNAGNNRGKSSSDMHEYAGDWQRVVDMTGLLGRYEMSVNDSLPPQLIRPRVAGATEVGGAVSSDALVNLGAPQITDLLDPAIFSSVQKLGLKLQLSKAQLSLLVIKSIDQNPSN